MKQSVSKEFSLQRPESSLFVQSVCDASVPACWLYLTLFLKSAFLVLIILRIILQLPLRTDGRFVSSGFTKHIICTPFFFFFFFNNHCTPLFLSPKEIRSVHVMFYNLQSKWFSLRLTKHHWGFLVFSQRPDPKGLPQFHSSWQNTKHSITSWEMRRLDQSDLQIGVSKVVKGKPGSLCCRNCREFSDVQKLVTSQPVVEENWVELVKTGTVNKIQKGVNWSKFIEV